MISVEKGPEVELETLAAVTSGRTDPAVSLLFECAMEMNGVDAAAGGATAGASLEAEAPAQMREGALAEALAAIDKVDPQREPNAPEDAKGELIRIPLSLRRRIEEAEQGGAWKSRAGLRTLDLVLGGDCKAEIMRIPPGAGVPRHTHHGQELTLCLSGGFSDGIGSYGPGDVSITDPSITHRPVADPDGPCYVLAVTDAGLKFTGLLGLLQKFFAR